LPSDEQRLSNNSMQRTALRAAADAERWAAMTVANSWLTNLLVARQHPNITADGSG
jgi:hypothetical protein